MLIQLEESQLVFIDYSLKQIPGIELAERTAALRAAKVLGEVARLLNVPIFGAEQVRGDSGEYAMDQGVRALCQKVISKAHFDACEDGLVELLKGPVKPVHQGNARSLPKHLQKQEPAVERMSILIAGYETHLSVLQTALSLVEQEFDVCLVTDACASAQPHNHDSALDRLAGAGVELVTMEMVVFEWLGSPQHPSYEKTMKLLGR